MLTSKYHVSTDSSRAILFYWDVLFIYMVGGSLIVVHMALLEQLKRSAFNVCSNDRDLDHVD